MTYNTKIAETLNLPMLDDVLKQEGIDVHASEHEAMAADVNDKVDEEISKAVTTLHDLSSKMKLLEGTDHSESMDSLHGEILQHARELMTYGYNVDHPRARGIFEIAASMYGHAMSAKNSKRDAQLKAMKLALDRRHLELEEKRTNHTIGQIDATTSPADSGSLIVADRNELLRGMQKS